MRWFALALGCGSFVGCTNDFEALRGARDAGGASVEGRDGGTAVADEAGPPPSADLLVHLPFDEGSGVVAKDASGHGRDAEVANGTWTTGIEGGALRFDSGYARVPSLENAAFPASGTLSFWLLGDFATPRSSGGFFDSWENGRSHLFVRQNDTRLQVAFNKATTATENIYDFALSADPAPPGTWMHVVVVWDTAASRADVYTNGKRGTGPIADPAWRPSQQQFVVGVGCQCAIDEVRLYGRALGPEEVAAIP